METKNFYDIQIKGQSRMAAEYERRGDFKTAAKLRKRVQYWKDVRDGRRLPTTWDNSTDKPTRDKGGNRFFKNNTLNTLTWIFLIVILPIMMGVLMAIYIEVLIGAVVIVPGLIAFLCQALHNGANIK